MVHKLKNTLLNNQWAKKEVMREIRKYFEIIKNKTKTYWNLVDAPQVQLTEKFITVNIYIK